MVDKKRQVFVHAEAFGEGAGTKAFGNHDQRNPGELRSSGEEDAFAGSVLVAESGYSSEATAEQVLKD